MARRTSLTVRLLTGYSVTVVVLLAALALLLDRSLEAAFLRDLTASLRAQAEAVGVALGEPDESLQARTRSLGDRLELRITVIGTDGVVLADSARDPLTMENHARRAEVRAAIDGRVGVSSRTSATTGQPYRYVALPPMNGRVVRVALPMSRVRDQLAEVRAPIVGGAALAALVGVGAMWVIARRLTRPLERLTSAVAGLSRDERTPIAVEGPTEMAVLAETLNRMAGELEERVAEVREGQREREAVLSAMEEGVVVVDPADTVRYSNPAATRLLGGPPDTLRSLGPAALRSTIDAVRAGEQPAEVEVEVGVPSRVLRASAVPMGDEVLLVLRDVSAARRVQAMRRDFVADASHELKTPAASIRAAAETVEAAVHDDPAAAGRFAAQLRRDAVRLSRIVSDLLDLSRLESERPEDQPVRLDRVVREELDRLREPAAAADVTLDWEGEAVTVRGSGKDLGLLARNLLDNAVRYTPSGGRVRVEVSANDGAAILTITDSGIGIPSRDIARVFERFYRVDRARSRETGGTGLGLSIARHVVEQHGGSIEADSELGRGSTFRVTLPRDAATGD